jgi:hypothetical protein
MKERVFFYGKFGVYAKSCDTKAGPNKRQTLRYEDEGP